MSKKLNIVVGKFGKSLLFDKKKWGMIGGDHEAPAMISILAQMNPNINFYILGRSDWKKLDPSIKDKINVNENIFNVWGEFNKNVCEDTHWPTAYFKKKGIHVDYGLFMSGPSGASTIPEAMYTIKKDRVAKPSEMFRRYVGPITRYLNDSGIPYAELGEDPRYFPVAARDLFNRPKYVLSTKNVPEGLPVKTIDKYMGDVHEIKIPIKESKLIQLFMASEPDMKLEEPGDRGNLMSIYSNGLTDTGGMHKFPHVKEYVLDNFKSPIIYGDWPDEMNPGIEPYRDRFKKIPMMELQNQMYNTKYAFLIPIQVGWPTIKYYKHLIFGMIPFLHPFADPDRYMPVPEFTRLESAQDFKEKVYFLESNPDEYLKLWHECQALLKHEYFAGEEFNQSIIEELKANCNTEGVDLDNTGKINYNMSCLFKDDSEIKTKSLF
jgi:hypothetical protein